MPALLSTIMANLKILLREQSNELSVKICNAPVYFFMQILYIVTFLIVSSCPFICKKDLGGENNGIFNLQPWVWVSELRNFIKLFSLNRTNTRLLLFISKLYKDKVVVFSINFLNKLRKRKQCKARHFTLPWNLEIVFFLFYLILL